MVSKQAKASRIPAHVLFRQIDEDTVILDLSAGLYYGLTGAGSDIWQLLDAGSSLPEMCQAVVSKYDVSFETARQDIEALLEQLVERQLIAARPQGDSSDAGQGA